MNGILKVTEKPGKLNIESGPKPDNETPNDEIKSPEPTIAQVWFWPRLRQWLEKKDTVITETGKSIPIKNIHIVFNRQDGRSANTNNQANTLARTVP